MSNQPISGLAAGAPIAVTDLFADTQSVGIGPTKVTAAQLKTFIGASLTLTGTTTISNPFVINGVTYNWPSANGTAGSVLTNNGAGLLTWNNTALGTVTSVDASGGFTGLTFTGGPVTTSGTLTLGGVLGVAYGGTGATTAAAALINLLPATSGSTAGYALFNDGANNFYWAAAGSGGGGGGGGVSSVTSSVTGFTFTNPTTSPNLTGVLAVSSGGTGGTTITQAQANLLPSQAGNNNKFLMTNGSGVLSWQTAGGAGGGVTTVATTLSGITVATPTGPTATIGGTLGVTSGGTGKNTAPTAGQVLIGTSTGTYNLTTLTQGPGITITPGNGTITISGVSTFVSTFSAGSTGFTPSTATSGAITLTGKLNIASGGTNLTTVGPSGTTLVSNGTALAYGNPNAAINLVGGTLGQVPYQTAVSTTGFSGPGATGTYLAGNGAAAPTWNAAQTTVGTTVLSLGGTTTILAGLTGASVTAATITAGYPFAAEDLTPKQYVDAIQAPINRVAPVDLATTAGDGNQSLTGTATIDGTPVVTGMRVLVKNQTNMATAGIYVVDTTTTWTRATDLDQDAEFTAATTFVTSGSTNANTSWIQTVPTVVVGTTAQAWTQQSGLNNYIAGTGITITGGNTINNDGVLTFQCDSAMGLTPSTATKGVVTLAGTLNISNGGTSATTAQGARTNILPTQAGQNGKFLQTNGTDVIWSSTSAGSSYYIPVSGPNTIAATILGAGFTDILGNEYTLYNGTASAITLTTTTLVNFGSFPGSTATNLVIPAGTTMMISTVTVGSSYAIGASTYNASDVVAQVSIAAPTSMAAIVLGTGAPDNVNKTYLVTNSSASAALVTTTVANPNAFPGYVTSGGFTIPAGATATVVTATINTSYLVTDITNSVSTNLSGGAAGKVAYQSALNATAFTAVGTAGQLLQSNGTSAPTWVNPASGAIFRSVSATTSLATLFGASDKIGSVNIIYNSSTSAITLTGTIDNYLSYTDIASSGAIILPAKQTVTIATDVVGTNYSIMAASEGAEVAGADFTVGGTVSAVLTAAGLIESVGSIYTLTNTTSGPLTINAATFNGSEAYEPAATGTSVIVGGGESITLIVQAVSSTYLIVTMSHKSFEYVSTSSNVTTTTLLASGLVGNNAVVIYNSGTSAITVTAAGFSNYQSYINYSSATVFTLAPKATVSIVLDALVADTWQILSYSSSGNPVKFISLPNTTPVSVSAALTTAGINDAVGSEYVFYNGQTTNVVLTATYDNGLSYPSSVSTTNLTLLPKQSVTLVTGTVGTNYSIVAISVSGASKTIAVAKASDHSGGATIAAILTAQGVTQASSAMLIVNNDSGAAWPLKTSTTNDTFANASPLYVGQISGATPQLSVPDGATVTVEVNVVDSVAGNVYEIVSLIRKAAQQFTINAAKNLKDYLATNAILPGDLITITNTGTAEYTITAESFVNGASYSSQYTPVTGADTFKIGVGASVTLSLVSATSTTVNGNWNVISYSTSSSSSTGAGTVAFSAVSTGGTAIGTNTTYPTSVVKLPVGDFNTGNYYNVVTGKFQPSVAGYYQINAGATLSGSGNNALNIYIYKNGVLINYVPSFSTSNAGSSSVGGIVYLNGSSDYLELGAAATTGYTPTSGNMFFNGALINQQTVTTNASSGNFMLNASTNQTMTALLAAQTPPVTDLKNNIYVINNTASTPTTISATGYSGYQSWPSQATATTLTIPGNGYAEVMTTSAGAGYQIITISSVSINAGTATAFSYTGTQVTVGSRVLTVLKCANKLFDTGNSYDTTTGIFNPKVAGYYQLNATVVYQGSGAFWYTVIVGPGGAIIGQTMFDSGATAPDWNSLQVSGVAYFNGTTDTATLQYAAANGGVTLLPSFNGVCINQQKVISSATSSNFVLSTSVASQTVAALIAAQTNPTITDIKDNVYIINNTGASAIALTATGFSGYQAWPTQATATTLTIPVGGYAEIITTSAGNGYQIIYMSQPFVSGTVAFSTYGPSPAVNLGTSSAFPANKIIFPGVTANPQSYYDTTTGKFNPKIAGYYQVDYYIYNGGAYDYMWLLLYKNGSQLQNQAVTNTSGYGSGAQMSCLVYMNGTTDYLETAAYYGSTGGGTVVAPQFDSGARFSASLVTQQRVVSASGVSNYILSSATTTNMPALIATASPVITDIVGNVYSITNSGSSTISITATSFSGYSAYSTYANSTTLTLPVNASAVVMTTAAGSGYQIMSMSVPASAISTTPALVAVGNTAGTSIGVGANVTVSGFTYTTITSFTTPDASTYQNPQSYYNNTTGKFQPLVAGFYQIVGRVSSQGLSAIYSVVIKNAFEVSPSLAAWALNQGTSESVECSGVVYMNGTTDYLVLGLRTSGGSFSIVGEQLGVYFSAIAVNNQVVNAGSASTNYNISTSTASQTVAALLAAQAPAITDVKNNVYVINNSSTTSAITLTGTYSGYQAFPLNATSSSITLPIGATAEIMTTTVGTGYQIVTISTPVGSAASANVAFNVANAYNTSTAVSTGTIVDSIGGFTYYFTKIPTVDPGSYLNPQSAYNVSTGKFQPTVAGYYQVNAGFIAANSYAFVAVIKNGTTWVANNLGTGSGDGTSASGVVFLNGTTDYVQMAVCNSNASTITSRGGTASAYFNAVLTTQQYVYSAAGANANYAISTNTTQTIPALLAAQTTPAITDVKNNVYVINNTNNAPITLSATAFSGYQAFPLTATATTITLDPGATAEIMTTSAGSGYQIVTISSPVGTAIPSNVVCSIGNSNATQPTILPGTIAIGPDTYNFTTIGTPNSGSLLNPVSAYDTTTGKFTPTKAGYYQVNANISMANAAYLYGAIVKNGTTVVANTVTPTTSSATPSTVVFMNGTTDYLQVAFATNNNLGTTFRDRTDINYFSAALLTQQSVYLSTNQLANANYNISTSVASQTLAALLTANSITDILNNIYVINNSGSNPITVTATSFTGYQSFPTQSTATSITIPVGGFAEIMTTVAGTGYQIVTMSQPFIPGSVAFRGATSSLFTDNGLTAGAILATVSGVVFRTMLFNSQGAAINPQSWYDPATGKYTPKAPGYYEVNFRYMFRGNSTTGTSGYVAIFKNGSLYSTSFDDTASYCCPEIGSVVYMNGATDYLQVGASVNSGATTLLAADGSQEWDISLTTQQSVLYANNGLSGNYAFQNNSTTSVSALITANGVTDVLYNQYSIYNDGGADVVLSDFFLGWEGFSGNATSTAVTLPAGATLTIITVAAGGSYQIVNISLPYTPGSVAFKATDLFAYTTSGMKTVNNYTTIAFNQPAWFEPGGGTFTPQIAGYYQLNVEVTKSTSGYLSAQFLFNGNIGGTASQPVNADNSYAGATNPVSVTLSEVFYFNGMADNVVVQVSAGTNQNVNVTFSGFQTNQTVNNGTAAALKYNGARGDCTATNADVAVATLDNIQFGWYGSTSGARPWVRTTSGTANLWGGWTVVADTGGTDFYSADFDATNAGFVVPLVVTTARQNLGGNWASRLSLWAIMQDSVSGNTYRVTFYLGNSFKGMQTNIERLN